jgi:hypothetical protein
LSAFFVTAILWTAPLAAAQVRIDTSSPESVIVSLTELHESWTLVQFTEFLRTAMVSRLPDETEQPGSWREAPNRWEFLPDTLALFAGLAASIPLVLESDPFIDQLNPEKLERFLWQTLRHGLEGRTIDELVRVGRNRERAVLIGLREKAAGELRELEEGFEHASAVASDPGASTEDRYAFERLQRRLVEVSTQIGRLESRLNELEGMAEFVPGALGCSFDQTIDRSISAATMTDLETLAATCPQNHLIRFLRAAAFVSEVPASLAEPGARMHPSVLLRTEDNLSSALQAVVRFPAILQADPLVPGTDSVPARFQTMLDRALGGRTIMEVIREGEKLERAFLVTLREDRSKQLRSEIEKQSSETSAREAAALQRANSRTRDLRADIERVDRRLAKLDANTPAPRPPDAH